jgi:hypothetical protein
MITNVLVNPPNERFEWDHDFESLLSYIIKKTEEDSILLTVFWVDQCNFELSPFILKQMAEKGIALCITTQEE